MKPIPLFGTGVKSYAEVVTAQRRVNCIYDIRTDQDRSAVIVVGTPGYSLGMDLSATVTKIMGMISAGGRMFALVYLGVNYNIYEMHPVRGGTWTYTDRGNTGLTILSTDQVFMDTNGADILITGGTQAYCYNLSTDTGALVVDVNKPYGEFCYLDSYYVGRPYALAATGREFNISATLDGTTWTPYVFGTKESYSDPLLTFRNYNGTLVLFGTSSMEFWQNVGSSPLPFQRIPGTTIRWGLRGTASVLGPSTLRYVQNTYYFLATDPSGTIRVARLNGYNCEPVSTSDIETILALYLTTGSPSAIYATTHGHLGHAIYQITVQNSSMSPNTRTLAYDTATGMWHEAATGSQTYSTITQTLSFAEMTICMDRIDVKSFYYLDSTVHTDNGEPIYREVCTRHIRSADNLLTLDRITLDMQVGVGGDDGSIPSVSINVSRDGGKTFGPTKTKQLGYAAGDYQAPVSFRRLGSSKDFVVKISSSSSAPFIIAAASANLEAEDE